MSSVLESANELTYKPELPLIIDSTMLTAYRSCQRKYYYSFLHNLRSPARSIHLIAGAAFAAGLEAARRYAFAVSSFVPIDQLMEAAYIPFSEAWGDYEPEDGAIKTFDRTFAALEFYLTHHHPQKDEIQPAYNKDGNLSVEFSFAIPIPVIHPSGDPFMFAGRFDMLGKYNDLYCIVDEKTTSALGATWAKQFDLRGQFLGYCWATRQLGYRASNVFVRGIAIKKTGPDILTAIKQYPDYLIDRWYEQMLITLKSLVAHYEEDLFSYNFGDACSAYGGCLYSSLCEAHDDKKWMSNYTREVWSPINSDI